MRWRIKWRLQLLSFPLLLLVLGLAWKYAIHHDKQLREDRALSHILDQPEEFMNAAEEIRNKKQLSNQEVTDEPLQNRAQNTGGTP